MRRGFDFRHTILSAFMRLGDATLVLCRIGLGHVAGFIEVPQPAANLKARHPGGSRKSNHTHQRKYDARNKGAPVTRDDSVHMS